MIRVTLKNGTSKEYDNCEIIIGTRNYKGNEYKFVYIYYDFDEHDGGFRLDDGIKIEKKVKDLTNEEMIKLNATLRYDFHFKEWYVAVAVFKDGQLIDEDIYRLNDYIDITDIVKEGEE